MHDGYIRFCDDFVIVHKDRALLSFDTAPRWISYDYLCLGIASSKVFVRKLSQGIDFVGQIALPHYQVVRTITKRRMYQRLRLYAQQYRQGHMLDEFSAPHCRQAEECLLMDRSIN